MVTTSTAPNVSSVAFAAPAGANANDNGSGWGDFEKPLDMLLAEELEMLKEKRKTIAWMKEGRRTSKLRWK